MAHVHTRVQRWDPKLAKRTRIKRPKSFKTEEAAKKWAEDKGIKGYELKDIRAPGASDKKIIVVEK